MNLRVRLTKIARFVLYSLKYKHYKGLQMFKLNHLVFQVKKNDYDLFLDCYRRIKGSRACHKEKAKTFFFKKLHKKTKILQLINSLRYKLFVFILTKSEQRKVIRWLKQR
jgi:hypothetical protein